ncbi:hypothetical protein Drorol1_Dr00014817, partial [Drosera rotundifolia]
ATVYHDEHFCFLDQVGELWEFRLTVDEAPTYQIWARPEGLLEDVYNSHLVECEGELPVVFLGALGKWVQIFRLIDSHWVEVDKLDNQMLFLNRSSTFCVAAPSPKGETGSTFLDFMAKASSFTRSAQRSITLLETMPRSMISMVQERCWVQHGFFLIHNCKLEYNFTRKSPSILCQDSRDMY